MYKHEKDRVRGDVMDPNLIGLIIAGVLFAAPVVIVLYIIIKIRMKLRRFEKDAGIKLRADDFIRDLKSSDITASSPASLNGMDSVYVPRINRDYPQLQISAVYPQVETFVKTYLDCIESGNTEALDKLTISPALVDRAGQIIEDMNSQGKQVFYDNIVIHKTVISEYVKEHGMVIIRFQAAVGYKNFVLDSKGKVISGSREKTQETVYEVSYANVINSELARQSGEIDVLAIECPNCGAPIRRGSVTVCEFCKTEFHNLTEDVFSWTFTDIKEKNRMTRKLY